jgi:hypothetical protein
VVDGKRKALGPAAIEDGLEALAFDEFVRNIISGLDFTDSVDLDDVGALDLGRELRLVHQAFCNVAADRDRRVQAQDAHDLLETRLTQLGSPVLRPDPRRLDFFEEDELPELFLLGHGRPFSLVNGELRQI